MLFFYFASFPKGQKTILRILSARTVINKIAELINEYDTDGSGQIEFPEFCNMMSGKISTDSGFHQVLQFYIC